MIKTLSPYTTTAKTAEIMSRYRPIAPKPEGPAADDPATQSSIVPQKMESSPYLRNLWPQMQARPTRTRKRGRAAMSPPSIKRQRSTRVLPLPGPTAAHLAVPFPVPAPELVTLSLLPCSPEEVGGGGGGGRGSKVIDLNITAEVLPEEESGLQLQLQDQQPPCHVISPRPIRPVGSSICVGYVTEERTTPPPAAGVEAPSPKKKRPEEVEDEVESESYPTVISDSNNKVRLANSAYKEMVGQPECSWLDCMVTGGGRCSRGGSCNRICGEVSLDLSYSRVPTSSSGFSCWVRIEWGSSPGEKSSVSAFCDVNRLACESKDYLFSWRFHTHSKDGSEASTNNA